MASVSSRQVRALLLDTYAEPLARKGISIESVTDDFDLLREGIIDSLGILDMVTALESQFEMSIDFEELDAEKLTHLGSLCRYVEASGKRLAS